MFQMHLSWFDWHFVSFVISLHFIHIIFNYYNHNANYSNNNYQYLHWKHKELQVIIMAEGVL